jgi:enoyl-CoA hydratase/carnithine racemase
MTFVSTCPEVKAICEKGVLTLTLNRADKKNALTLAMYQSLYELLNEAEVSTDVRAVVLTGGNSCFTAGNDLTDFLQVREFTEDHPTPAFVLKMISFTKPIIASVSGVAVGVGATLLLLCDMVYADATAKFQLPFTSLGLCPEAGCSLLLPRLLGYAKASELLLTGRPFMAEEALQMGIVNDVVVDSLDAAQQAAIQIALLPAASVRLTKKLMRDPLREQLLQVAHIELEEITKRLHSAEAKEAFTAFLEKREPDFSGFD